MAMMTTMVGRIDGLVLCSSCLTIMESLTCCHAMLYSDVVPCVNLPVWHWNSVKLCVVTFLNL